MRILYHHRIRGIDGQAVHVRAMAKALAEEGHEVREVALEPILGKGRATDPSPAPGGRPWRVVDRLPGPLREIAEYGSSVASWRMVRREAELFRPDFIYERHAFGNAGGVLAARGLGIPVVLEVNSPLVEELSGTRGVAFPAVARRLEALALGGADLVVVVSEELREKVLPRAGRGGRVLAIPNAVDASAFRPPDGAGRSAARRALGLDGNGGRPGFVLGFSGFVREWHRLDLVLECLARPELADARLVVAGEGPHSPELARRAAELGVADRVVALGTRLHEEMPGILTAFDVAVLAGSPPYASPLKLYEYLAAGLPVVAPAQENLREVLRDRENALLFAPGDAGALAGALVELRRDAALRERLGAQGRATVLDERRSWRGVARRVVAEAGSLLAT
jgi:glycosyltransferase involved in cell wall biosynthesis